MHVHVDKGPEYTMHLNPRAVVDELRPLLDRVETIFSSDDG